MKRFNLIIKIYQLVDKKLYFSNILLIFLFIIQAFFEILSIGLILPILNIVLNEDFSRDFPTFFSFFNYFNINSAKYYLISCISILFFVFLIKNFISLYISFYQASFAHNVSISLSKRVFSGYLNANYSFHVNRNTSKLVRNIHAEVNQFNAGLLCFNTIVSDFIIVIFILIFLLLVQIESALIITFLFSVASIIYYVLTRKAINRLGTTRLIAEANIYKIISQALFGIRDIILLQSFKYFQKSHLSEMKISAGVNKKLSVFLSLPRLWIETIAIGSISLVIIIFALQDYSFTKILSVIGLFAAAGFRLLPSINRLLGNTQKLKVVKPVIENFCNELKNLTFNTLIEKYTIIPKTNNFNKSIEFKDISFFHDNKDGNLKNEIFSNINFKIKKGELFGILGKSGSGKSTLIDLLSGLIQPTSGEIIYDEQFLIRKNLKEWQSHIAYVSQNSFLVDSSIKKNIAFGIEDELIDINAVKKAIKQIEMEEHINSLPADINTLVGENGIKLSGGQRQRICIARYLYFNRDILIFDESTSALDVETEKKIVNTIKKLKGEKTIIIVSHRVSALQFCDRFLCLENGNVNVVNNFDEVLKKYPYLK